MVRSRDQHAKGRFLNQQRERIIRNKKMSCQPCTLTVLRNIEKTKGSRMEILNINQDSESSETKK